MMLHTMIGRGFVIASVVWLFGSSAAAQRTAPPPPAEYDAQIRYSIRAGTHQRIALFQALERHLESIGFRRIPSDDEFEAADQSAERIHGTLPSDKVREVLRAPQVRTVLLLPAGMTLPTNPDQRVLVQIELESRLSPSRRQVLAQQARQRLAGLGFVEKVGYDHQNHVRLLGTIPAGEVESLLVDLRDLPSGWLAPDVPRRDLPEPIRNVNPIRVVEVLREPAGLPPSADAASPAAADSTLEKLPLDLRDVDPAEILRMDVILAQTPGSGIFWPTPCPCRSDRTTSADRAPSADWWRALIERDGVVIEGRLGPVVAIRGPAGVAKDLIANDAIATVRRSATATRQPPIPPTPIVADAVHRTGLDRLSAGQRGRGVIVAVIDTDFRGAERINTTGAPATTMLDLTAARNADLQPDPQPSGEGIGAGTQAALAARLAAPECSLVLVRIDRNAAYMIGDIVRYLHGDATRCQNLVNRNQDLLADHDRLRIARQRLHDEQTAIANDFTADDAAVERRLKLAAKLAALDAEEKAYLDRLTRFTELEEKLINLRRVGVVTCGLAWDIGYPVDGSGPLSRVIDQLAFATTRSHPGLRYWMQAAGDTRGQVWNGLLLDRDENGVFEFAEPEMPLPLQRWTRELNFLGWQPAAGQPRSAELPAGAKVRVALQWTEVHDRRYDTPEGGDPFRTPLTNLRLSVLHQRDPSGTQVATDDFNVVARSMRLPELIERTGSLATYETIIEFTVESPGVYALRLEGALPASTIPAEAPLIPAQQRRSEPRARLFVEAIEPTDGRPVFADFAPEFGGLGTPGDAVTPRTIGAANERGQPQPFSATGPASGRDLLAKPSYVTFNSLPLPGGTPSGGTATAAGFAGGFAACLISAGAPADPELRWLGIPRGGVLIMPSAWIEQVRLRQQAFRP